MDGPLIWARRLATSPLVFIGPDQPGWPLGPADQLAGHLAAQPAWSLVFVTASLENDARREAAAAAWRRHRAAFPAHRVVFLCNSERELFLMQRDGVAAILCNHNIVANDAVFTVDRTVPKRFDAIYNGRMMAYKRHALARAVGSVALVYYDAEVEPGYLDGVRAALPHAAFLNAEAARAAPARPHHPRAAALANRLLGARGYVKLPPPEVARALNAARVGLCLSAEEGAMVASLEYLLCGLPVVSTRSIGGREFFFDPEHTIVADDEPGAIAAAVAELVRRDLDPAEVRARALWKLRHERAKFAAFVRAIAGEAGVEPRFDHPLERLFAESLMVRTPIARLLAPAGAAP